MSNQKPCQNEQETTLVASHEEISRLRRRRVLTSGLGASAIITTVASRPAWAQAVCTKSGLQSANLSGHDHAIGCGISSGWWKNNQGQWPTEVPLETPFSNVFTSTQLFQNKTLSQVINPQTAGTPNPGKIGKHAVAAYLNAVAFPNTGPPSYKGYAYTAEQVKTMFAIAESNGISYLEALATTFETANDQYDNVTVWPTHGA